MNMRENDSQGLSTTFMHHAFISYSRKDAVFASHLEKALEAYTPPERTKHSRRSLGHLPLEGHNGPVLTIAFSPDGKTLASGSEDNTIILWDVMSRTLRVVLTGHAGTQKGPDEGRVRSIAFSPDGKTLASGGSEHPVLLWRVDFEDLPSRACTFATRNLTRVEWRTYVGDALPYERICTDLPATSQYPDNVNLKQLEEVQRFRQCLAREGILAREYDNNEQFENVVHHDLDDYLQQKVLDNFSRKTEVSPSRST